MNGRRSSPAKPSFDPERFAKTITDQNVELYGQFSAKLDGVLHQMEVIRMSLQGDIRSVQHDVRLGDMDRQNLASQLRNLEMQLGEVRDGVALQKIADATKAAEIAVKQAMPAVQEAVKRAAPAKKLDRIQISLILGIGGMFLMQVSQFAEKAPQTLKFVETIWKAIVGMAK